MRYFRSRSVDGQLFPIVVFLSNQFFYSIYSITWGNYSSDFKSFWSMFDELNSREFVCDQILTILKEFVVLKLRWIIEAYVLRTCISFRLIVFFNQITTISFIWINLCGWKVLQNCYLREINIFYYINQKEFDGLNKITFYLLYQYYVCIIMHFSRLLSEKFGKIWKFSKLYGKIQPKQI